MAVDAIKIYGNDYDVTPLKPVSIPSATIMNDTQATPQPLACRYVSVAVTGTYTINESGAVVVFLNAGVLHPLSLKNAITAAAGTVTYWY